MAQNVVSGALTYVNYGYETTFGTVAASFPKSFGHGTKVSLTYKNNQERIFGVGARNASTSQAKKFEGSANVEFALSHCNFLRGVLGTVDSSSTPTYTEANTVPSFSMQVGSELGTNDAVMNLLGCKVNSMTLNASVGEMVRITLDVLFADTTVTASSIGSAVALAHDPYTFAGGVLELPTGSTLAYVQSLEYNLNNNLEYLWGIGSRKAVAGVEKTREHNFKFTLAFTDPSIVIPNLFGDASDAYTPSATGNSTVYATLKLTFTNGAKNIVMTFANVYLDEDTINFDVNEFNKADVTGHALSCTNMVWTNGGSTDNATP
jgi:hypothetical protein